MRMGASGPEVGEGGRAKSGSGPAGNREGLCFDQAELEECFKSGFNQTLI